MNSPRIQLVIVFLFATYLIRRIIRKKMFHLVFIGNRVNCPYLESPCGFEPQTLVRKQVPYPI